MGPRKVIPQLLHKRDEQEGFAFQLFVIATQLSLLCVRYYSKHLDALINLILTLTL